MGIIFILDGGLSSNFHLQHITLDEDLKDINKWYQIQGEFEIELKAINLPPKTGVNKFENSSKRRSSILLITRYRTELNKDEFVRLFNEQLVKNGWIFYGKEIQAGFVDYKYCRGNFDATLSEVSGRKIWSDGGNYFQLSFGSGLRTKKIFGGNEIPESCK
jgi:hypothetical protein